jgi:hypothetical protein
MASLSRHQKRNTEEKGSFLRKFSSYFNFATLKKTEETKDRKTGTFSASCVYCILCTFENWRHLSVTREERQRK